MSVDKVREYFRRWNIEDRIMEFPVSSATVAEAAVAVGCTEAEIAKAELETYSNYKEWIDVCKDKT